MSRQPFMQLWIADFLGDTLHLTDAEVGQYMLLLMAMWRNGGVLPSDPKKLARIARNKVTPAVLEFFEEADGGNIYQARLLDELEKARAKSQIRSRAGKAGAAAKALKKKERDQANASANGKQDFSKKPKNADPKKPPKSKPLKNNKQAKA